MCCVFPGELSSVGCFVHKTTRIVGGGPVGISEGSWMVSIQKGYRDVVHILHMSPEEEQLFILFRRPGKPALEFITFQEYRFFLVFLVAGSCFFW